MNVLLLLRREVVDEAYVLLHRTKKIRGIEDRIVAEYLHMFGLLAQLSVDVLESVRGFVAAQVDGEHSLTTQSQPACQPLYMGWQECIRTLGKVSANLKVRGRVVLVLCLIEGL